jgi:hypothetical protein
MKRQIRILLCPLIWAWIAAPELLAAEAPAGQHDTVVNTIYTVLPLFIIGGVMWWFLRKSQRAPFILRSHEYYDRAEQHMQRMEQIGERIAAALEKKDKDAT